MAASRERYAATFSFVYGGIQLDPGRVIELRGLVNDQMLIKHRYLVPVAAKVRPHVCAECGAEFVEDWQRTKHGDMRHAHTQHDQVAAADMIQDARRHPELQHESGLSRE